MRKLYLFFLICLTINVVSAQEKPQVVPGNIIVQVPSKKIEALIAANQTFNGQATGLKLNRLLSAPMAAYLLEFNENIHHEQFLQQLWNDPSVTLIQLNHYIQNRETTPNDPQLNQQWWHINNGAGSATADADIDSDEAWDITTGGVTATGDTIVVCVVDDGGDLDHPDLIANNWVNYHEIPNNNIDDDNNGYVDDYLGLNPVDDDDDVDGGSHGVNVAGMVGAVGNNGTGVSGVNWNVKIMNMTYGSIGNGNNPNEANVIESYTYPLVMRRLYEQTGGAQGAFVVATNSSWGINNGNPANAPIWCAFYDTLGTAGILSAGATANNNVNIDNVGDLPTGCSSEYMISVTATNNQDVRTFSGYGATTVDLGAPGEDVRTTAANGNYTTTSGTSFASPATAGAVALMYSAPCASLAAIAHANPSLAAQMVRDAIFNGVDPVANLANECVTGGRLNLKGALDEILNNCSSGGCLAPFTLTASNITDTDATVSWNSLTEIDSFNISYGIVGGTATDVLNITDQNYGLTGLDACTEYWFTAQSICDGSASDWSDTLFFQTDGCCEPPSGITITLLSDTGARTTWPEILAATGYYLSFRPSGGNWVEFPIDTNSTFFIGLEPCTDYEVRVATVCTGGVTDFSPVAEFSTFGCGACTDNQYCTSAGSTQFEWISNVTVGDLDNTSGASESGYEDFSEVSVDLQRGESYTVSLSPDFAGQSFREHFRIWIDLNQNGTFSAPELVYDDSDGSQNTVTGSITIPLNAQLGSTRMRVSMAYGSNFGGDYPQTSCDEGQDGEVEDYCVNIIEEEEDTTVVNPGINELSGLFGMAVYPVPSSASITVELNESVPGSYALQVVDMTGKRISEIVTQQSRTDVDIVSLAEGIYILQAVNDQNEIIGRARFIKQ